MSSCYYTAQGQFLCQKGHIIEGFNVQGEQMPVLGETLQEQVFTRQQQTVTAAAPAEAEPINRNEFFEKYDANKFCGSVMSKSVKSCTTSPGDGMGMTKTDCGFCVTDLSKNLSQMSVAEKEAYLLNSRRALKPNIAKGFSEIGTPIEVKKDDKVVYFDGKLRSLNCLVGSQFKDQCLTRFPPKNKII
jgi:hypothetical protein